MHSFERTIIQKVQEVFESKLSLRSSDVYQMWKEANDERKELIALALAFKWWGLSSPVLWSQGPSPEIFSEFILGKKPKDLAPGLTRAEADRWIHQSVEGQKSGEVIRNLSVKESIISFLWSELVQDYPVLEKVGPARSIKVARWLRKVMDSPYLRASALRVRTRGFIGEVEGRVIDRLDEIEDCDLRRSPWGTIENAVRRIVDNEWSGENELLPHEEWFDHLPKGVRVLWRYTDLRSEGIQMRHCIASYANRVSNKECIILSIYDEASEARSTAEIRNGKCVQHVGFANREPPKPCVLMLENLIRSRPWENQEHRAQDIRHPAPR